MCDDVQKLNEIHQRTRRIETRLTRFIAEQGFETGGRKPEWQVEGYNIVLPNVAASLTDILAALPKGEGEEQPVPVTDSSGELIGYVLRP